MTNEYQEMLARHRVEREEFLAQRQVERLALKLRQENNLVIAERENRIAKSQVLISNASELFHFTKVYLEIWKKLQKRQLKELNDLN
ncbi:hypothetical protein [Dyadobacter sp. CY323]|uniref:hypothetical protein n=1 Tax=Dyadobacter sp. CY323 TaxID=2907302 RepID=UPI001F3C9AA8|nr:hypothetical protein [Dyadobacter sp. CY323]MCE6989846.1 hypothetical protein [Dyadobacter sp. CY323]